MNDNLIIEMSSFPCLFTKILNIIEVFWKIIVIRENLIKLFSFVNIKLSMCQKRINQLNLFIEKKWSHAIKLLSRLKLNKLVIGQDIKQDKIKVLGVSLVRSLY